MGSLLNFGFSLETCHLRFFLNLTLLFLAMLESGAPLSSSLEEALYKCSICMNDENCTERVGSVTSSEFRRLLVAKKTPVVRLLMSGFDRHQANQLFKPTIINHHQSIAISQSFNQLPSIKLTPCIMMRQNLQ